MMTLFLAFHVHATKRGDGLLPEFLGLAPGFGTCRRPQLEIPRRAPNSAPKFADPIDSHRGPFEDQ